MMNERIEQLLEQARAECFRFGSKPATTVGYDELEKFAELIVRECLAQADALRDALESDGEDQQALGADWVGLAISRHFGVES
jgi:hypothetical protein